MRLQFSIPARHRLERISLLSAAALYFVWPLPHSMALRYLLLLVAAATGALLWADHTDRREILRQPWLLFLGALLGWVIFHAAVLSENGAEAWHELTGEWLKAYLAMIAGIGVALAGSNLREETFRRCLIAVAAAHPVLFLFLSTVESVRQGGMILNYWGLVDHKMSLAFFSHFLACLACAKLLEPGKPPATRVMLWIFFAALAFYVAIITNSRNSIVLLSILYATAAGLWIYRASRAIQPIKRIALLTILPALVLSGIAVSTQTNEHWKSLVSDARIAVQTDAYPNWINREKYGLPKNAEGDTVSDSNYARIAFLVEGSRMILQHPLGYGVSRHAFEQLVRIEHPEANIANSHNGYIDFVSAVGFPALLLLLAGVVSALKQIRNSGSPWVGPATWMMAAILLYWMLDPVSREHYLEAFLFVIGLFSTLGLKSSFTERPFKTESPPRRES